MVDFECNGGNASLICQQATNYIPNAATVAEFKGPNIFGVVRIVQVDMEFAQIEAKFTGLSEGVHGWSINEYGDITRGAASTGKIYNSPMVDKLAIGDLGVLVADANGKAEYSGLKPMLTVADLPGRSLVIYESQNKDEPGIVASVFAWTSGLRANCKNLCACDGTVIWDYTNNDPVKCSKSSL